MKHCPMCGYSEISGEQWRDVENTNGLYRVSSFGRVVSYTQRKNGYMKQAVVGSHGYPVVSIKWADGTSQVRPVHTLVADAFLGPRPSGYFVNHKDGSKLNSALSNLEYSTPSQNTQHAVDTGLMRSGERSWNAKVTIEIAKQIRSSDLPTRQLARKFGISISTVHDVQKRRTWRHVAPKQLISATERDAL